MFSAAPFSELPLSSAPAMAPMVIVAITGNSITVTEGDVGLSYWTVIDSESTPGWVAIDSTENPNWQTIVG